MSSSSSKPKLKHSSCLHLTSRIARQKRRNMARVDGSQRMGSWSVRARPVAPDTSALLPARFVSRTTDLVRNEECSLSTPAACQHLRPPASRTLKRCQSTCSHTGMAIRSRRTVFGTVWNRTLVMAMFLWMVVLPSLAMESTPGQFGLPLLPEPLFQERPSSLAISSDENVQQKMESRARLAMEYNARKEAGRAAAKEKRGDFWTSPQMVSRVSAPISSFQALAAINSTDMRCNGRVDLCDMRYNQVTYPGTHNSAAYDLKYDCSLTTQTCLQSQKYCVEQSRNCTLGFETRCTKMSNTCLRVLPRWLQWLCGAFSSACEATEQFCLGWEEICTGSLEVCTLWGSACLDVIPNWALPCLWENQPGHPIWLQLNDGIRFLDLGTCLTNNNTQAVMCHGSGIARAIGVPLDTVLSEILQFILQNPYEVLTIEFNEYDGDVKLVSAEIVKKILQYFTLPSGELLFWSRSSPSERWPTLREMILANKRIVLFFGDTYYPIPDPKPGWANQKDMWKMDGFRYTSVDTKPEQLNQSYFNWCTQGPPTDGSFIRWQQIDINLGILKDDIVKDVKQGKVPQLCIGPLAVETNSGMLDGIAEYCYWRWPYWFRVRVNDYWEGHVFQVANLFNDRNVARVKAGETLTPY